MAAERFSSIFKDIESLFVWWRHFHGEFAGIGSCAELEAVWCEREESTAMREANTVDNLYNSRLAAIAKQLGILLDKSNGLREHLRYSTATKLDGFDVGNEGYSSIAECGIHLAAVAFWLADETQGFLNCRHSGDAFFLAANTVSQFDDLFCQSRPSWLQQRLNEEWRLAMETDSPFLAKWGDSAADDSATKDRLQDATNGAPPRESTTTKKRRGPFAKIKEMLDEHGKVPASDKGKRDFIAEYNQTWAGKPRGSNASEVWPEIDLDAFKKIAKDWKAEKRS